MRSKGWAPLLPAVHHSLAVQYMERQPMGTKNSAVTYRSILLDNMTLFTLDDQVKAVLQCEQEGSFRWGLCRLCCSSSYCACPYDSTRVQASTGNFSLICCMCCNLHCRLPPLPKCLAAQKAKALCVVKMCAL